MAVSANRSAWGRALGAAVGMSLLVCVVVLAFLWPVVTSETKDIPVVVAGQGAEQVATGLESSGQGAFDASTVADRDAAVEEIQQRDAYGAVVLGAEPEVLVASAASPAVAQMLRATAPALQAQLAQAAEATGTEAPEVVVTDVVPLSASDPTGAGLAAAGFPLLMGGFIGGIGLSFIAKGAARRATALLVYSASAGLLLAGILQGGFDILQGDYLANAGAYALTFAAIGAPILGLIALIGRRGIAFGPVVFMLFANPISSANAPTQFLPGPWGEIGQWFPPGASANLVRSLSYFPDASIAFPVLVLAGWAIAGFALILLARPRKSVFAAPASEERPAHLAVAH